MSSRGHDQTVISVCVFLQRIQEQTRSRAGGRWPSETERSWQVPISARELGPRAGSSGPRVLESKVEC